MSASYAALPADLGAGFNPFPGLRPFEAEEDYLFFGRERQTDDLLRKLRTTRFLSILGRSGSGKSSLVRSGLIPALWGGSMTAAGSQWRVVIMRPGEDPMASLARALMQCEGLLDNVADAHLTGAFFETTLRASDRGLVECIRQAHLRPRTNVLVLVDQFEEIFRYKRSRRVVGRDEAAAFVKLLLTARASDDPIYIAVTMRSDFIGDCMEFGSLPEVINDGIYLVPRMARDELKSAITGPVAVGGGTIAPRLVSRLLNDVGDDPDQLPILQHALMRTWDRWLNDHGPGEPVDLRHYEAIGALQTALSRHAEEAFGELDERQRQIAQKLFQALTDKGTDARGVRRPAPLGEIAGIAAASAAEVAAVVEVFRKPGRSFLMPPAETELHETSIIDISHESLMRIWERLSTWAEEEARAGQLYQRVARAAQRHAEGTAALWRDPELQLALSWRQSDEPTEAWAARYDPSFAAAMTFLDASRDERDAERLAVEERRRYKIRQSRIVIGILSAAFIVTMFLGGYAYVQEQKAMDEAERALKLQQSAEVARHTAIKERDNARHEKEAADIERKRAESETLRAEAEKLRADDRSKFADEQRKIAQKSEQDEKLQKAAALAAKKVAEQKTVEAEKARQETLLSEKKTLRLSHVAAARALALTIPAQKEESQKARSAILALEAWRLNNDGEGNPQDPALFAAMRSAYERLEPPKAIGDDATPALRAFALLPDGRGAFAGGEDGRVLRVDFAAKSLATAATLAAPVRAVAIAPDGEVLAAGTAAGEIRLLDPKTGQPKPLAIGDGTSGIAALAASKRHLAAGALDGSVRLWSTGDFAAAPTVLRAPAEGRITSIAFSSDGALVAAGIARGGALIWSTAWPTVSPSRACASLDVRSLAFSPNGGVLACGGARGQIVQETLGASPVSISVAGHQSSVNALAFERHGRRLASASSDGVVRIWEAGRRDPQPIDLAGHKSWVWSVAFLPDGDRLVSAGEDRAVRTWPARAETMAGDLCRALSSQAKKELTPEEWSKYMPADQTYRANSPCAAIHP